MNKKKSNIIIFAFTILCSLAAAPVHADYSSTILNDSPTAYWRLNETAATTFFSDTFTDTNATALSSHTSDSGHSWTRHTSSVNNASIQSNEVVNDGVTIYYASVVPNSANYDVEVDLKINLASTTGSGVAGRVSTSTTNLYFLRILGGTTNELQLFKTVAGVSTKIGFYAFTPSNSTTYTLKLSMNGTSIKGYLDGVQRISVTDSAITAAGRVGMRLAGDDTMDNLSATGAFTTTANDTSGNGIHGSYLPYGTSWTGGTFESTGALTGDSDTAITFNGTSGYVSVADNANLKFGTGDFTLEFWAKTSSISTTARLLGKRSASGTTAGYMVYLENSRFKLLTDGGVTSPVAVDDGVTRSSNTWYHIAASRSQNTLRMYVNGVEATTTASQSGNLDDVAAFEIGTVDNFAFFGGQIDDVAVYDTALSAGQILAHYEVGTGATNYTPIVSLLGPSGLVDGSSINDDTPTLEFTIEDSDLDEVSYNLQVSTSSSFTTLAYSATSTFTTAGLFSTTTTTLADGSYYWRVLAGDGIATSTYNVANLGQVAFVVDTSTPTLQITSPRRDVVASSTVATISYVDQRGNTVYIPHIQTSDTLSVAASAGIGLVPVDGGVKFVLNEGLSDEEVLYDMSSPYSLSFTSVPKGSYTLDAYVVDSDQVVVSGSSNHDIATNIGIGDIYIAIGDSITKGAGGLSTTDCIASGSITDWTHSLPGTVSNDNRNYCQWSLQQPLYFKSWMPELNNELSEYNGYPVFILNEGYGGYQAAGFLSNPMASSTWQSRINSLQPNKWLVLLSTNDTSSTSTLVSNMTNIVNSIQTTYDASSSSIYLGLPLYAASRPVVQTYIAPLQNLVSTGDLGVGPNFNAYFYNHPELYIDDPAIHPNPEGYLEMARLWALSIISPKNLSAISTSTGIEISWDDLSTYDEIPSGTSEIAGYKVRYGTSTENYSTTVDVGNSLSTTITGLTLGETYYFTVFAYDSTDEDVFSASSPEVSAVYSGDVIAPIISSINSSVTQTTATITWVTDEDADSQVEYGLSSTYTASTTLDSVFATSHTVNLSELEPNTTYHYRVVSKDSSNNTTTSSDQIFTTATQTTSSRSGSSGSSSRRSVVNKSSITPVEISPIRTQNYNFIRDLTLQSSGDDVKALQMFLISKGFLSVENDTGFFGPLTQSALAQYQTLMGIIPSSGYFGPITRSIINTNQTQNVVTVPVTPGDTPILKSTFDRDISFGSIGEDVRALQKFLNSNQFFVSSAGDGSPGFESDYFGPATQAALIKSQAAKGIIPAAGYFGPKTRSIINY